MSGEFPTIKVFFILDILFTRDVCPNLFLFFFTEIVTVMINR